LYERSLLSTKDSQQKATGFQQDNLPQQKKTLRLNFQEQCYQKNQKISPWKTKQEKYRKESNIQEREE
jgi:hypothetical protein